MDPKLVACMFCSILVGGAGAGMALVAGGGPLAALAVYSLAGSAALVPSAILVAHEPRPRIKRQLPTIEHPTRAVA